MTTVKVVNLTPHQVTVFDDHDEVVVTYPPSGEVARLESVFEEHGALNDGSPFGSLIYGALAGLPEPDGTRLFIVSLPVKLAALDREDVLAVACEVRDAQGRVVGCKALATVLRMEQV